MAFQNYLSTQKAPEFRGRPVDDHGKLRYQYFNVPAVAVQGDAASEFELCEMPPGAVRILLPFSRLTFSAFGVGRTLDVGHRAYMRRPPDNTQEAQNPTALATAIDVSAALANQVLGTKLKYDIYSMRGFTLYARCNVGTVPVGATLEGLIAYLYE